MAQNEESPIEYPESDGTLMGESQAHVMAIVDAVLVLREYFRTQPNVLVGGDMMMYYQEGNPHAFISPDTFVVFGVPNYSRRTYLFWNEGRPPTVAFEFTSLDTRDEDFNTKIVQYAELGIQEYILFDPWQEYLVPSVQGYRLVNGRYEPLTLDADGWLVSQRLGLSMRHEGLRLRLRETATGKPLLWSDEVADLVTSEAVAREQAQAAARAEAVAREQAEAQLAALQAELARLRGEA